MGVQLKRGEPAFLFTMLEDDGSLKEHIPIDHLRDEFVRVSSGHFGLTIFRADRIRDLPKPWFVGIPNEDGEWKSGRIDEDMHFWKLWRENGRSLYMANRVRLGHIVESVLWPGADWHPMLQMCSDYDKTGMPEGAQWKDE
jgi:hypothetical protein